MANEITVTAAITFARASAPTYAEALAFSGIQITQVGNDYGGGSQVLTTTEANLAKGNIDVVGMVILKNLDATDYVLMGTVTGELPVLVGPGEVVVFRAGNASLGKTNIIAKCSSGTVNVQYLIIEN